MGIFLTSSFYNFYSDYCKDCLYKLLLLEYNVGCGVVL